jgi:hypothetical protein
MDRHRAFVGMHVDLEYLPTFASEQGPRRHGRSMESCVFNRPDCSSRARVHAAPHQGGEKGAKGRTIDAIRPDG